MSLTTQQARAMGKTSSRKGIPNKATQQIREKFKDIIEGNIDKFQEDLDQLEPKERLRFLIDLSRFVLPTLKAIDMRSNDKEDFKPIVISFKD